MFLANIWVLTDSKKSMYVNSVINDINFIINLFSKILIWGIEQFLRKLSNERKLNIIKFYEINCTIGLYFECIINETNRSVLSYLNLPYETGFIIIFTLSLKINNELKIE